MESNTRKKTVLSWSSGKDSAWALYTLQQDPTVELVGLLTTFNESASRVAMHAVRRELCREQAQVVGLPLIEVDLPSPCSNEEYQKRMAVAVEQMKSDGVTHCAFGDLFLEDVRD
ncbi:MAG: ATP-binding protein, partial [Planctomycetes bacterium]|nr:ATP-binding protein [Planctomycetota bacterium]